jgi:hypothetical protein
MCCASEMIGGWSCDNSRPSSPPPRSRGSAAPAIAFTWSSPELTEAGRVFLPAARRTLAAAAAARETIDDLRAGRLDLAIVALQAHLVREFRDIVGESPTEFFTHELRMGAEGMDEANLIIQRPVPTDLSVTER